MQVMLLAAGLGTRLRPLTDYLPKPLFPVLNEPNLKRLLLQLSAIGADKITINAFHLAQLVVSAVKDWGVGCDVNVITETQLLGTGGGIKNAFSSFNSSEPILVINSDVVTDLPLDLFWQLQKPEALATMLLHDCKPFNNVQVSTDNVIGFRQNHPESLAYTGICVLRPEVSLYFNRVTTPCFSLIDLFEIAMAEMEKINYCLAEDLKSDYIWYDIGTPRGYLEAHASLLKRQGASFISKTEAIDSLIHSGHVKFEDWAVIGSGVTLEGCVKLKRCVIWDNFKSSADFFAKDTILTAYGGLTHGEAS